MGVLRKLAGRVRQRVAGRTASVAPEPRRPAADLPSRTDAGSEPAPVATVSCSLATLEAIHEQIFAAGKPLLVNHWATWCDGCIEELPLLVELHGRVASKVDFLGISWDGFQGSARGAELLRRVDSASRHHGLPWNSLVVDADPDELFDGLSMDCQTVPQLWVVDAEGSLVHRVLAVLDETGLAGLERALELL